MPNYLTGSDGCCSYRFRLTPGKHYLGRRADCDFVVFSSSVSRRHAEVTVTKDGRVFVRDLDSHNGTFVAGNRIESQVDVSVGSEIRFGSVVLKLSGGYPATGAPRSVSELDSEQAVAANVQKKLINFSLEPPQGYDIATYLEQCVEIGGDFFDIMPVRDGGKVLIVADVSGHGMGAALLMSHLLASFRTQCMAGHFELLRCVHLLSELLASYSESTQFATIFIAQIRTESGQIEYINAGHCAPIVVRSEGDIERLESTGTVVGMPVATDWLVEETNLGHGDTMFVFTDGLTEAECNEEQFGEDRLLRILTAHRDVRLQGLVDEILDDMDRFTCGEPRTDDLAIVALRKL